MAATALACACSLASRLEVSCTLGDTDACEQVGGMHASGVGAPRDIPRASVFYERVCEAGRADVCNELGELYERGAVPGVPPERTAELFSRACEGGSAFGCVNLGLVLAAEGDEPGAVSLFERACDVGAEAGCYRLALALEKGEGAPKNVSRAVQLYEQACEQEYVDACLSVATLFSAGDAVARDPARVSRYGGWAVRVYDAACKAGVARDCDARDRTIVLVSRLVAQAATVTAKVP